MQTLKQWFLAGYAYGLPTMRRPMMGPISFGLLFGGIPLALIFSGLAGRVISPELLRYLVLATPVSVLVTTVATALGAGSVSKRLLLCRAFSGSLAACVPLPILTCLFMVWRWGYPVSENLFTLILFFLLWAIAVGALGWLLTLIWTTWRIRYTRVRDS